MKFVFLGYDFMLPVAEKLIQSGHELTAIMSFPCDQTFSFNHNCQLLAKHYNATYIESPITDIHIDSLISKGTTAFISAGYPHKIPPIDESKAYSINIHPSYLPYARGPMPAPHILLNQDTKAAGFTIHKLSPEFDEGEVLYQEQIPIETNECVEKYCARILTKAPEKLEALMQSIDKQWSQSTKQDHNLASYYTTPDNAMRTLDWSKDVETIMQTAQAFGRYGCIAQIGDRALSVFACDGWIEKHNLKAGTCITIQNNLAVIAAKNGFIALKEFREER